MNNPDQRLSSHPGHEAQGIPYPDFDQIAENVIEANIFPDHKLISPYGNIGGKNAHRIDVGRKVQRDFNLGFRESLQILLPPKDLIHFILLATENGLWNKIYEEALISVRKIFVARSPSTQNESLAWNTDALALREYNRTREGFSEVVLEKSRQVMARHPDLAVAIAIYEALTRNFLTQVGRRIKAKRRSVKISTKDLKEVKDQFTGNSNFLASVIPSVMTIANEAGELKGNDVAFTPETISRAVEFMKEAGFFRNELPVKAHFAEDGKDRIHKVQCPASGNITEVMLKTLGILYEYVKSSKNPKVEELRSVVKKKYQPRDW